MKLGKMFSFAAVAIALSLTGCGGGGDGGGGEGSGDGASSGGESTYAGDISATANAEHGEEMFQARCAGCHGGGGGPSLDGIAWEAPRLRQQIREGSAHMPPISERRLSDSDMEDVLAYMVTTGGAVSANGPAPAEEPEPTDPEAGLTE